MTQAQEQVQPVAENPPAVFLQEPPAEINNEIEIIEDSPQEAPDAESAPEQKQFDPKTDKVDFSTPEQQEKFNHVYKQMKMSDARNQMLNEMLQTQQKRLEDLEGRFKNTDSAEAEQMLLRKIKSARDSGDDMAEIGAINELVEFKADKKISERSRPQSAPVNHQVAQDTNYVASLMQETDATGNPLRPYLYEGHPEFENSIQNLERISQKYIGDPQSVPKSLAELDQLMRAKMTSPQKPSGPPARTPNPMQGGNLTNVNKKTTIKMSPQEMAIAKKLGVDPKRYAAKRDEINGRGKR